jgi:pteridine reductase
MQGDRPVALVTGGARRIGAEICRRLHACDHTIALHYHHSDAAATALAAELNRLRPDSCRSYRAELLQQRQCADLACAVLADFGQVDLLVNNASAYFPTPAETCTEGEWNALLDTNLRTPFFLSQALLDTLQQCRGCIVNIIDAHIGQPQRGYAAYDISKNGLAALTRSLALELAPHVRVNGVAPGAILWPDQAAQQASANQQQRLLERIPLQRLGECEDIANAVLFLAQAPYVTGQVLAVDGGVSLAGHNP